MAALQHDGSHSPIFRGNRQNTSFASPLRRHPAPSTCLDGDHAVWWLVQAANRDQALALLPDFVARRTDPIEVRDVDIP